MGLLGAISRESIYIAAVARTLALTRPVKPDARITIADWTGRWAREQAGAPALLYKDKIITYAALEKGANRYAQWAAHTGLKKGDVVTLLMENCPDYIMAWLGLTRAGCVAALVNTNLTGQPLGHSVNLASAKHLLQIGRAHV
mgnify:CR=1 FL=1